MLSLDDCLEFSNCSHDEIDAIAEHEHVPDVVAAEIGNMLLKSSAGVCLLKLYMIENIEHAYERRQYDKAMQLETLYRRFDRDHPGASPEVARVVLH